MCRKERETSESAPACVAATNQVEQPADRDGEASGKRRGMEMSGGRGEGEGGNSVRSRVDDWGKKGRADKTPSSHTWRQRDRRRSERIGLSGGEMQGH